jgi:Uma2 family endonuclease
VDEYERLIEIGILKEDEPVELINGEIVEMSPIGPRHIACVTRSSNWLARNTGPDIAVPTQNPIQLPIASEPQPDIVVHRAAYNDANPPTPADIILVIEVAESSLEYDRGTKLPLYAAAGIPEAWLFNLVANRIERHTDPGPGGYQSVVFAGSGQRLPSTVLPTLTFDAAELLGLPQRSDA